MPHLSRERLLSLRLRAQGLETGLSSATETVARLGAVQSQDRVQSLVAVGLRTPGSRFRSLEAELDDGRLVRTHVLRPTWHLVAADDLRWIMALTGPRVAQAMGSVNRRLGLTPEVLAEARRRITQGLDQGFRTRDELVAPLRDAGFPLDGQRAAHYLMDAEIHLIACSGPRRGKENTYDLVDRRVKAQPPLPRDEALARLALRYVTGHGPATAADFSWWSGLSLADARRGLEASSSPLTTGTLEGQTYWYVDGDVSELKGFRWLAGFDEFVVAFTDRKALLDPDFVSRAMTTNGIFPPVILYEGRVAGNWKRLETAKSVQVEADWFRDPPPGAKESRIEFQTWLRTFLEKPEVQ